MPINRNSFWVKFQQSGFYYRVKDGILKQAPIKENGEVDIDKKVIVKNIDTTLKDLNILDKINQEFGANFQYKDFEI